MKIGLTEQHGMAQEQSNMPPEGIEYQFLEYQRKGSVYLNSPMKGFMSTYKDDDCDVVEAILTPANTNKPWLYSLACFEEAVAFSFMGLPIPKFLRIKYMEYIFQKDNFKGLLFWSEAGKETLKSYGNITNSKIWEKSYVVYPAIRPAPKGHIKYTDNENVQMLFNGNFFIKGGANVVDVFEQLQKSYPNITLRLCCDEKIDFHTGDLTMRNHYLKRIKQNSSITMGRVKRHEFLNSILPNTDIYLLPTYGDAFGFAVLEAMSYGIPVVSTNYMAIPEMIIQGKTGFMADISAYDCKKMFKGCYVSKLDDEFKSNISKQISPKIEELIISSQLRMEMGSMSVGRVKEYFSMEKKKTRMSKIYNSIS